MNKILPLCAVLLAACQTTLDPNYAAQLDAYRMAIAGQHEADVAKARAEEARYVAIAEIAGRGDLVSRQTAIIALALSGRTMGDSVRAVVLPTIPESQEDRALKWAAIFAGPIMSVAQGYFGYKLGVTQSNNAASTTIASYNTLGATSMAGYQTVGSIANNALAELPMLRPTLPNVTTTINGNGVIGAGTYTGDNSGANSNNTGIIRQRSPDVTNIRNCVGGATTTGDGGSC